MGWTSRRAKRSLNATMLQKPDPRTALPAGGSRLCLRSASLLPIGAQPATCNQQLAPDFPIPRVSAQVLWFIALFLLAGCVRYQPQPISAASTAEQLESRSLTDPGLRTFLQQNLHRELDPWPATTWD